MSDGREWDGLQGCARLDKPTPAGGSTPPKRLASRLDAGAAVRAATNESIDWETRREAQDWLSTLHLVVVIKHVDFRPTFCDSFHMSP